MPPGPTTSTRRSAAEKTVEIGQLVVAADEVDGQGRQVPDQARPLRRTLASGGTRATASWLEDPLLEVLELRTGVETELVGQLDTDSLIGIQGVGLAAAR